MNELLTNLIYFEIIVNFKTTTCGSIINDVIKKLFARVTSLKNESIKHLKVVKIRLYSKVDKLLKRR